MELPVDPDTAVHLGRLADLAVVVEFQFRVDPADVLSTDERDTRYGGSDGEVLPVCPGDLGRPERSGEDGNPHRDLDVPSILGPGVYFREYRGVGVSLDAFGESLRTLRVALDVQVRVVDRVVFVSAGRDLAERAGIENFPAPEGGEPDFAGSLAPIDAPAADAGHGHDVPGTVGRSRCFVSVRSS